jgi:hypothetical protein
MTVAMSLVGLDGTVVFWFDLNRQSPSSWSGTLRCRRYILQNRLKRRIECGRVESRIRMRDVVHAVLSGTGGPHVRIRANAPRGFKVGRGSEMFLEAAS